MKSLVLFSSCFTNENLGREHCGLACYSKTYYERLDDTVPEDSTYISIQEHVLLALFDSVLAKIMFYLHITQQILKQVKYIAFYILIHFLNKDFFHTCRRKNK